MNDNGTKIDDGSRIDPGHSNVRNVLRVVGPILLGLGILFFIAGAVSFFIAFGGMEAPKLIWAPFVGILFMGIGGPMTQFGYMGKVARYAAGEMAPVAKDTFNYVATESKEGITAVASAIGEGALRAASSDRDTGVWFRDS